MVHGAIGKTGGALMTGLARSCRLDMAAGFTFSRSSIMAARTISRDTGMVHRRPNKTGSALMAGFTSR